jgi:hypothetical protein
VKNGGGLIVLAFAIGVPVFFVDGASCHLLVNFSTPRYIWGVEIYNMA